MSIVSRDELKNIVGRTLPHVGNKPTAKQDGSTEQLRIQESLREQAARMLKELNNGQEVS